MELWEAVTSMLREKFKQRTCKNESTNAKYSGGIIYISDEVFVMKMEQRDYVIQLNLSNNQKWEDYMKTTKAFEISKFAVLKAYELVKRNKGGAGIDEESIADFERNLKDNLYKIWNRLSSGSYFPPAVKAVPIPKKSGGVRILGVPTVADRIAQMVVKIELESKLEPHFHYDSYGYRPNKSAHQAIEVTRKRC
jgi:RNA-directed DNA polymerase